MTKNKYYTFSEFINRANTDSIAETFGTSKEVNDLLISIYKKPEFVEKLRNTKSENEALLLLLDTVDQHLEVDSIKDFAFISFQLGKAMPGILGLRATLQLKNTLERLKESCQIK